MAKPNEYGYNAFGLGPLYFGEDAFGLGGHRGAKGEFYLPVRESEVASPTKMMAIGDGLFGGGGGEDPRGVRALSIMDGSRFLGRQRYVAERGGHPPHWDNPEGTARAKSRHQGKANVLFCDGHIVAPMLESLFLATGDADLRRWNRDHQPHRERLAE